MTKLELEIAYLNRQKIEHKEIIASCDLWTDYQINAHDAMSDTGKKLSNRYLHLIAAIKAHIARNPTDGSTGRVIQCHEEIVRDL